MDFKFNVNRLLPRRINKVTHTLIPEDFRGDRREFSEYQRQLSRILDEMGEASARAQGLSKPITSAMKMRDTDHIIYLLVDSEGNGGLGCVIGLLKTGSKNLFMFDKAGAYFQLQPRCVLDFYIHETRQRMGLGRVLYQHMLTEEHIKPVKLAIDRPSEKFLQFLHKHYNLEKIIPQNNKFVVFEGFFDDEFQDPMTSESGLPARRSIDESLCGNSGNIRKTQSASVNGHTNSHSATAPRSAYGRYAAARPPCSMANIIHNTPTFSQTTERTGEVPATPTSKAERPRSLSLYTEDEEKMINHKTTPEAISANESSSHSVLSVTNEFLPPIGNTTTLAVEPKISISSKVEVNSQDSKDVEDSSVSSSKSSPSCAQEVGGTQSGHLDLKFYHSPLW